MVEDADLTVGETTDRFDQSSRLAFWVVLWLTLGAGLAFHALDSDRGGGPAVAAAVCAGVAIWLHVVHGIQRWDSLDVRSTRPVVMLVPVYAALFVLLWLDASYLVALFGVYLVTFGFCERVRLALFLSGIVTAIWLWAWVYHGLPFGGIATPVLVWVVANLISNVTSRVSAQNEERRQLIVELVQARSQLATAERERGTLEERGRVAAEIHDTLAQGFTSIVLVAEATRGRLDSLAAEVVGTNLGMIEETARTNLAESRRLIEGLRPKALEAGSLAQALRVAVGDHDAQTELRVIGSERALGGAVEVVLLRAAQEALANVTKHARASRVDVTLDYEPDAVALSVSDNGIGRPENEVVHALRSGSPGPGLVGGQGLGLLSQRVSSVGGQLRVSSPTTGTGTVVHVRIPTRAEVA